MFVSIFVLGPCLPLNVLGVLGILRVLRGLCVFYALCTCYTFSRPMRNTVGYKSAPPARIIRW